MTKLILVATIVAGALGVLVTAEPRYLKWPSAFAWEQNFTSSNLVVIKDLELAALGKTSSFTCTLPDPLQEITSCLITTPTKETWTVVSGQVLNQQGQVVDGYEGMDNGNSKRTCGIRILAVKGDDLGEEGHFMHVDEVVHINRLTIFIP